LSRTDIGAAAVAGYGPSELVTPLVGELKGIAEEAGLRITSILRVEDGRYWLYRNSGTAWHPAAGTPFALDDHPYVAAFAASGTLVLPSREALAATLNPGEGKKAAELMRAATRAAEEKASQLAARAGVPSWRATAWHGITAVKDAVSRYRDGEKITAGHDAAWLAAVLKNLAVRDDAWARMDPDYKEAHLRLWTDITRLAPPGYVAAPASLLAFTAWQAGDGGLANVALDRALSDNPGYSMAHLLRQAIDSGAPPSMARPPLTPEEVAAAYDADCGDGGCPNEEEISGNDVQDRFPRQPGRRRHRRSTAHDETRHPGRERRRAEAQPRSAR
jgi:hypothetical protein